jgi:hypothetical protein
MSIAVAMVASWRIPRRTSVHSGRWMRARLILRMKNASIIVVVVRL